MKSANFGAKPRWVLGQRLCCAFTLPEMLAVLAISAIIVSLVIAATNHSLKMSRQVECQTHLREVYAGFRHYSLDNSQTLPDVLVTGQSWEQSIESYLNHDWRIFVCPADREMGPTTGSSYDWRDTGDPLTTLSGAQFAEVKRPDAVFVFDALAGWHVADMMNVVRVNGSIKTLDQLECIGDLFVPIREMPEHVPPGKPQ